MGRCTTYFLLSCLLFSSNGLELKIVENGETKPAPSVVQAKAGAAFSLVCTSKACRSRCGSLTWRKRRKGAGSPPEAFSVSDANWLNFTDAALDDQGLYDCVDAETNKGKGVRLVVRRSGRPGLQSEDGPLIRKKRYGGDEPPSKTSTLSLFLWIGGAILLGLALLCAMLFCCCRNNRQAYEASAKRQKRRRPPISCNHRVCRGYRVHYPTIDCVYYAPGSPFTQATDMALPSTSPLEVTADAFRWEPPTYFKPSTCFNSIELVQNRAGHAIHTCTPPPTYDQTMRNTDMSDPDPFGCSGAGHGHGRSHDHGGGSHGHGWGSHDHGRGSHDHGRGSHGHGWGSHDHGWGSHDHGGGSYDHGGSSTHDSGGGGGDSGGGGGDSGGGGGD